MGEVCLDDENIGRMGFRTRPNHHNQAVEWPKREILFFGGGGRLQLAPIRMPSGECRIYVLTLPSAAGQRPRKNIEMSTAEAKLHVGQFIFHRLFHRDKPL